MSPPFFVNVYEACLASLGSQPREEDFFEHSENEKVYEVALEYVNLQMVSIDTFRQIALSFPQAIEEPHFEKTSFRINKKIFATLDASKKIACLLLSPIDQSVFCLYDKTIIYPVPNKWGQKGATFIELKKIKKSMCKDALTTAYCRIAPASLCILFKPNNDDK